MPSIAIFLSGEGEHDIIVCRIRCKQNLNLVFLPIGRRTKGKH